MKLIVGYLKVKTGQSPLVAMATNKPVTGAAPVAKQILLLSPHQ